MTVAGRVFSPEQAKYCGELHFDEWAPASTEDTEVAWHDGAYSTVRERRDSRSRRLYGCWPVVAQAETRGSQRLWTPVPLPGDGLRIAIHCVLASSSGTTLLLISWPTPRIARRRAASSLRADPVLWCSPCTEYLRSYQHLTAGVAEESNSPCRASGPRCGCA
ncbi:hypothetical protein OH77DRAFT_1426889 [Trametes cingulata]|nr:hypothetical protein OH77DRAFT_1426889 [Trametes cingulata]